MKIIVSKLGNKFWDFKYPELFLLCSQSPPLALTLNQTNSDHANPSIYLRSF